MRKRVVYKSIAWLFSVSLLLCAMAAPMLPKAAHAAEGEYAPYEQLAADGYWPGEIIVKFKDLPAGFGAFSAAFALSAESEGIELEPVNILRDGAILYRTHDDVLPTLAALAQDPRVEYVQPHYRYRLFAEPEPNDPYWDNQWDMHQDGWGIDLPDAWSYTQGSADVVVAVVDTGVDYLHEDLNDGSGRMLVLPGSNFYSAFPGSGEDADDPMDSSGHGTHVAGTIAAIADNGLGIAGIAPHVRIMPVKVGLDDVSVYFPEEGAEFAGDHGAKIVNLSLGGNFCGNPDMYESIKSHPDVLFVAAAGNEGHDLAEEPVSPAIYTADSTCVNLGTGAVDSYPALPNIVTVGWLDEDGNLFSDSNFSDKYVNLAAPGSDIYSLFHRDGSGNSRYESKNGTSMATPHVSGTAALIYSLAPDLTPAEVIGILEQTVTPSTGLIGKVKTGGTLNAGAAVAYTANRVKPVTADWSGAVAAGTTVTLSTYTNGADIYYTRDGSEPVFAGGVAVTGELYDGPISIDDPVTIKARAYKDGMLHSETAKFTYSILSSSTGLSSLSISSGVLSPAFNTDTTNYTVDVPYSTDSLTVTAVTYDPNAAIQINDAAPTTGSASAWIELNVLANDVAVKVTAEDGVATKPYHIHIVRSESGDDGSGDSSGGNPGDGPGSGGDPGDGSGSSGDPGDGSGSGGDPGDGPGGSGDPGDGPGGSGDPGDGSGDSGDPGDGPGGSGDPGAGAGGRGAPGDGPGDNGDTGNGPGSDQANVTTPAPPVQLADDPATFIFNPELDMDTNVATAVLDQETWSSALEHAATGDNGLTTVTFVIQSVENAAAYELTLPQSALASSGADARLEMVTDFAAITLPGNLIAQSGGDPNATISLSIARPDASQIPNAETRSLIGEHPIIRIELKIGGQIYSWSNPSAPTEISIPYAPAPEEQSALEHLTVLYVDPAGKATSVPSGRYVPNTGTIHFTAAHFSDYAAAFVRKSFGDLEHVPWAQKPIEVLAAKGVVQGVGAHSFTPGKNVTRADFVLMLVRMLGLTADGAGGGGLPGFDDVAPDAYYADAVRIARELGIAAGTGDDRFHPDDFISRQDMMVLTVRALQLSDERAGAGYLEPFNDKDAIAEYASDSLALLVRKGIVVGDGGELRPQRYSSRAEAAVLLYRIYNLAFPAQN